MRLLLAAKQNGLVVAKFPQDLIEKLVCDAHALNKDVVPFLQQRLESLTLKLQSISSTALMEKLNEDGLRTSLQFD